MRSSSSLAVRLASSLPRFKALREVRGAPGADLAHNQIQGGSTPPPATIWKLEKGDLVEVHWVDITEDNVGDPADAEVSLRISIGYFLERKDSRGVPCIVTTTTLDSGISLTQSGWCIYPEGNIKEINVIRRRKKNAKKTSNVPPVPLPTGEVRGGTGV